MARETLGEKNLSDLLEATSRLVKLPKRHMSLDYDCEADVLYLHFEEPPKSSHGEMREDGIIIDYRGDRLVGLTVLEASRRVDPETESKSAWSHRGRHATPAHFTPMQRRQHNPLYP